MNIVERIYRHGYLYREQGLEPEPMAITESERDYLNKTVRTDFVNKFVGNWLDCEFCGVKLHVIQDRKEQEFKNEALGMLQKQFPLASNEALNNIIDIVSKLMGKHYKVSS